MWILVISGLSPLMETRGFELAPDVPTFKEQGVDFSFAAQPMVVLAPKGTPSEVCGAFNSLLAQIYADPDFLILTGRL